MLAIAHTDSYTLDHVANEYGKTFAVTASNGKVYNVYRNLEGNYEFVMTAKQASNLIAKVIPAIATLYSATVAKNAPKAIPVLAKLQLWQLECLDILLPTWGNTPRYDHHSYYTEYAKHLMRRVEKQYL